MKPLLSIAIMACPKRHDMVTANLLPYLKHPDVEVTTSWDVHRNGLWWNAKRCWSRAGSAQHHMVIQDDAILCKNFLPAVLMALEANPDVPIGWYGKSSAVERVVKSGYHWFICKNGLWGTCVSLPAAMAYDFIVWSEKHIDHNHRAYDSDDGKMNLYLSLNKITTWMVVPTLIQHGGTMKSLIGHQFKGTQTQFFAGDEDPTSWNWKVPDQPTRASAPYPTSWQNWFIP